MKIKSLIGIETALLAATVIVVYLFLPGSSLPLLGELSLVSPVFQKAIGSGELNQPQGILFDEQNNKIYVSDSGNRRIAVFNERGEIVSSIGGGSGKEKFIFPYGLAIHDNKLYVSDSSASQIKVFMLKEGLPRKRLKVIKIKDRRGFTPTGIAVSKSGDLFVCDVSQHKVAVFGRKGDFKKFIGAAGTGDGQLYYPNGLSIRGREIYVSDSNNGRVQIFNTDGKFIRTFVTKNDLLLPRGVTFDSLGRLWAADTLAQKIKVFNKEGKLLATLTGEQGGGEQLSYPSDIAFNNKGQIYVVEREAERIQVWDY